MNVEGNEPVIAVLRDNSLYFLDVIVSLVHLVRRKMTRELVKKKKMPGGVFDGIYRNK